MEQVMSIIKIFFCLGFFLEAFASNPSNSAPASSTSQSSNSAQVNSQDNKQEEIKQARQDVVQAQKGRRGDITNIGTYDEVINLAAPKTLILLDIDDTVLVKVDNKTFKAIDLEGLQKMSSKGSYLMALTIRSGDEDKNAKTYETTLTQLKSAGIDYQTMNKGRSLSGILENVLLFGKEIDDKQLGHQVMGQRLVNDVIFANGNHSLVRKEVAKQLFPDAKPFAVHNLLKKFPKILDAIDTIVFVDNEDSHLKGMQEYFANNHSTLNYYGFNFTGATKAKAVTKD